MCFVEDIALIQFTDDLQILTSTCQTSSIGLCIHDNLRSGARGQLQNLARKSVNTNKTNLPFHNWIKKVITSLEETKNRWLTF